MISRRKILSRSGDEGHQFSDIYQCEGDVWFNVDKFIDDHIQEVLKKWDQLDDEIWAKIICMEKNQRMAKAYARSAALHINGSDHGFSDTHIGLNGFTNARDKRVNFVRQYIRQGVRLKVEQSGDIIIERLNKSDVFVKNFETLDSSANTNELIEYQKPIKLFDMKRFRSDVIQELTTASYPDRKCLERKCVSCVAFVRDSPQILQTPIWCLVINILALDLLKTKMPSPIKSVTPLKVCNTMDQINGTTHQMLNCREISSFDGKQHNINNNNNNQWLSTNLQNNKNQIKNDYNTKALDDITDELQYLGIRARLANTAKSRASFAFPIEFWSRPSKYDELSDKKSAEEGRFVDFNLDNIFEKSLMNGNKMRKFRIHSSALKPKKK